MYKIILKTEGKNDITIDEETILSFDDDELLNEFHLIVKRIMTINPDK